MTKVYIGSAVSGGAVQTSPYLTRGEIGNVPVTATGSTTARALKDWAADVASGNAGRPDWGTAATPYILAHRGAADQFAAPEHTWPAYEMAAAVGAAIEMDVRSTSDGSLIGMHDLTSTRTTGVTATMKQIRLDDVRRLNAANHAPWTTLMPNVWHQVPTFEEYLARYGSRNLLCPEIDSDVPTPSVASAIAAIQRRGLRAGVLVTTFDLPVLDQFYAADPTIKTLLAGSDQAGASVQRATDHHAWAISIDHRQTDQPYVAAVKAAGLKLIPYTVNDVETAEKLFGWGADGVYTDDTAYMTTMLWGTGNTPTGTTVLVPVVPVTTTIDMQVSATYGTIGSGWRGRRAGAGGTFQVVGGYASFNIASDGSSSAVIYPGIRTPEGTWSLTANLKLVTESSDATRYIGLRIGRPGDNDAGSSIYGTATGGQGYNFAYRQNGGVTIERVSNGAGTQIASATWNTIATGSTLLIRIDVTPTAITFTRTDNNQTITANDSQKSRRGFVSAFASGAIPGLGTCVLTY